jgi:Raf kinase inhibitor-like YbhB/YbcL family protein
MKSRLILPTIALVLLTACGGPSVLTLSSPAFQNGDELPQKYTCDANEVNPELDIAGLPSGTESLALILEDPDAPDGTYTHWIVFNIDPATTNIAENSVPEGAFEGSSSDQRATYMPPCPPEGSHKYIFKLFALDTMIEGNHELNGEALYSAMEGHILEQTELMTTYELI